MTTRRERLVLETPTLAEFLLTRIAEDERHWGWRGDDARDCQECAALVDQLLADCEARRRIVSMPPTAEYEHVEHGARQQWEWTLRTLAAVYADHPDYRDEWRP